MKKKHARVTQQDIAREVGVTQATVSLVVASRGATPRVSAEIARKILDVARKRDYRPHPGARQLAGKGSGMIGVMGGHLMDHFHCALIEGVERTLAARGLTAFFGLSHGRTENIERYLDEFRFRGVDGVLWLDPVLWDDVDLLRRCRESAPCAVYYTDRRDPEVCIVDADRVTAVRIAVRHLIEAGRKRIGLAAWTPHEGFEHSILPRREGYAQEIAVQGMSFDGELVFKCSHKPRFGMPSERTIDRAIEDLVREASADAIVAHDDYWAVQLVRRMQMQGLRVPGDVAVIGMGNTPMAALTNPAITTVDQGVEKIAEPMVHLLQKMIEGQSAPESERLVLVRPHLVVRESA
ncbi:MAG TPA: LacI family DNA-binding transcriptional regulator [Sumerlaeia bacterium]|nr:LacI family DNA-binding transcriptional regulator [Sumerlaeia bacterium]